MLRSLIYKENSFIGEAEIRPENGRSGVWTREIRISHLSQASDRCPPLAVLCTIAADGFCFKMESPVPSDESPMASLYAACLREKKTAVVLLGKEELHLVAMPSRSSPMHYSCFWGFTVASGLYNSCLVLLNLRCLGIVFDLDETLVVANTMRSFEDRINNLQQKICNEADQQRLAAMLAEVKRYQDDRSILKQFIENDQVVENGKMFKIQTEVVPPLSESHQQINRPVIRLPDKNIILTRVNPMIRDTSVLVRVRPAWEDLRSYLTARGRKRFEVYVCTMAERDYALEIWRLLDPESSLINFSELLNRIVCVKSELKKSLLSVFQDGKCHPKMALVVDDRLTVWDFQDKPRVHVVPAFAPYYAPQAEVVSSVAVLCVARNVACNVRGGFFKEYDEVLLPCIIAAYYEDEMKDLPSAPDVSNYLISEEDTSTTNGNKDPLCFDGMADAEVERRLKETYCKTQAVPPMVNNFNHMQRTSVHPVIPSSFGAVPLAAPQVIMPYSNNPFPQAIVSVNPVDQPGISELSLQGSPVREEGEVNESELDPYTRRRLLILQHGQDIRGTSPFQSRPHFEVSVPPVQSPECWLPLEEQVKQRQLNEASREYPLQPETTHFVEKRSHQSSFFCGEEELNPTDRVNNRNKKLSTELRGTMQAHSGSDCLRRKYSRSNSMTDDIPRHSISTRHKDEHLETGQVTADFSKNPVEVLQRIAAQSGAKVEYRTALLNTIELQFSVEAWFVGEKIGEGIGGTRKEAHKLAAGKAIQNLANHCVNNSFMPDAFHERKIPFTDTTVSRSNPLPNTSEDSRFYDHNLEGSIKSLDSVATLKELCTLKGFSVAFKVDPSLPESSDDKKEEYAQVEVAGQILGKGTGITWNEAKLHAADEAVANLKSMLGQFTQKFISSPRSPQTALDKSWQRDYSQLLQSLPSPGRFLKNVIPQSLQ